MGDSGQKIFLSSMGRVMPEGPALPVVLPGSSERTEAIAFQCPAALGRGVIPAGTLRRIGRTQKLALVAAAQALDQQGPLEAAPEERAVCVATGLGEIGETAAFLENMVKLKEEEPKPTRFTNSVHNSIAAQVAIVHGFRGENHTVTHGPVSFERALWQGTTILKARRARVVLVLGVDELCPYRVLLGRTLGWWRADGEFPPPLTAPPKGAVPGEGAAAFIMTREEPPWGGIEIAGLRTLPLSTGPGKTFDPRQSWSLIQGALRQRDVALSDIDLVLLGASGEARLDSLYERVVEHAPVGKDGPCFFGVYKHGQGEYCTASAMGTALAWDSLRSGTLSESIARIRGAAQRRAIKKVLLYHLTLQGFHSLCLLSR